MQTFLPYADFAASARVLDTRRLGKQRGEALQVLRAIVRPNYGWRNHPAVRMWRGYEEALGAYAGAICREWCGRGFADTVDASMREELAAIGIGAPARSQAELADAGAVPPWLGDERFHESHRASLLRKDPDWYGPLFGEVPDVPYVWPVSS